MTLPKKFEERVIREGIVDTRQYRYMYKVGFNAKIIRIELSKLDTTDAIGGWELVKFVD